MRAPVRGGPLPALTLKATRVALLAWSYEDALFPERGEQTGSGKGFASRSLSFNEPLWDRGSYHEFQRELERLRRTANRLHSEFYAAFVNLERQPNHDARVALAKLVPLGFLSTTAGDEVLPPGEGLEVTEFILAPDRWDEFVAAQLAELDRWADDGGPAHD